MKNQRCLKLRKLIEGVTKEVSSLQEGAEITDDLPEDIRYELMRLACSVNDYIFWVRKMESDEGDLWRALEIESGVHQDAITAREALDFYFRADVLDLPRREA